MIKGAAATSPGKQVCTGRFQNLTSCNRGVGVLTGVRLGVRDGLNATLLRRAGGLDW